MKRTLVLIIEPARVVAAGVESLLLRSGECEVVATYRSVAEFEASGERHAQVDVVVASVSQLRAVEGCEQLRDLPVVALQTALVDPESLRGSGGTISIYSTAEEILRVLREAHDAPVQHNYAESHDLSERERDVLVLVAKGYTNKEIATELFISPHTVISHRKNIVHKTGIRSVAGLTVYAVLNKLIDSEIL